jgi:5-methylcytosine-specific restriction endonuclease McrA
MDDGAINAALNLIADLDSIEQRKRLLEQERSAAFETARAQLSVADDVVAAALFSELYWALPDIGSEVLASLFGRSYRGGYGDLKPTPAGTGVYCAVCDSEIMAGSRSKRDQIRSEDRKVAKGRRTFAPQCKECLESRLNARHAEWDEQRQREADRQRELRTMTYSLYLKTPEWQATRAAALKRARYACQLCKHINTTLDVHHNTYDRRGSELASDLLVVCRGCHGKHHDKLPVEALS